MAAKVINYWIEARGSALGGRTGMIQHELLNEVPRLGTPGAGHHNTVFPPAGNRRLIHRRNSGNPALEVLMRLDRTHFKQVDSCGGIRGIALEPVFYFVESQ